MTSRKIDEWLGLYELQTVYTDDILWKEEKGHLATPVA